MKRLTILLTATVLSACSTGEEAVKAPEAPLHSRMLVLDTHLDTPLHFERQGWSFADRHGATDDMVQLDIPRMKDGNLDGGFFVIYTEQGALDAKGYADALAFARARSELIDATITKHSDAIGAARTAADARALNKAGKLIAYKSMENSYRSARTSRCSLSSIKRASAWRGRCIRRPTSLPTARPAKRAGTASARSASNGSPK